LTVGSTGTDAEFPRGDNTLTDSRVIWAADATRAIESRETG